MMFILYATTLYSLHKQLKLLVCFFLSLHWVHSVSLCIRHINNQNHYVPRKLKHKQNDPLNCFNDCRIL